MADETKDTVPDKAGAKVRPAVSATDPAELSTLGAVERVAIVTPEHDVEQLLEQIRRPPAEQLDHEGTIGAGGMGTVEATFDRCLHRRIAKKVIHPRLSEKERALFLFVREARITAQLDHPNIVPVHQLGEDRAGKLYFTMKRVQGVPFSARLERLPSGPLQRADLVEVLTVLLKVCDALSFAHSRGVLHCDIKPSNILVGDFGAVYLMDWGIARIMNSSVPDIEPLAGVRETSVGLSSSLAMGTPSYMSPEQASGKRDLLDVRSDVFSLGAILYRALAGRAPYAADSPSAILALARKGELTPPSVVRKAGVPPELQRIALKAMQKDPAERYPTVRQLRDDLQDYLFLGGDFPTAIFRAGEHIIHEGDRGYSVYIVERGRCRAYRTTRGECTDLAVFGPGDVFGETAILTDAPRTASVVALEDTTLYVVTREVMETELADIKPWLARLVRALAERFRDERERSCGGS
jgi:serine/threonine-protein kinase